MLQIWFLSIFRDWGSEFLSSIKNLASCLCNIPNIRILPQSRSRTVILLFWCLIYVWLFKVCSWGLFHVNFISLFTCKSWFLLLRNLLNCTIHIHFVRFVAFFFWNHSCLLVFWDSRFILVVSWSLDSTLGNDWSGFTVGMICSALGFVNQGLWAYWLTVYLPRLLFVW